MPIRIAHDPVGTPMLGSYMTGAGEAQKRAVGRRQEMQLAYDRLAARNAEHWQNQFFEAEQRRLDRANRGQLDAERREFDEARDIWQEEQKIGRAGEKAVADNIYNEVEAREKFLRENQLSPAGVEAAKEASWSLDWIRQRAARGEDRPGVTQQYMSQWLREFDARNPQSWVERKTPVDLLGGGAVYWTKAGMVTQAEASKMPPSDVYKIGTPNERGKIDWEDMQGKQEKKEDGEGPFSKFSDYQQALSKAAAAVRATRSAGDMSEIAPEAVKAELDRQYKEWQERTQQASPQAGGQATAPAAPLNIGDKTIGKMMDMSGAQADRQWAANTIAELSALYPNITGPADIKNPKDREELEKALQALEQQHGQ